ncbi:helix-turn-helix domain-containing protein [Micromonospora sp. WMMD882]|uniref:helix-turn-helix domain-containing protein n=1 Tax=Micromonospora sp. WMMD882 TaxID=3015151 RepID=UPI00248D08A7|nr:helix-turn-helix domain-containing protein [Micromonospora sp. WMMD882]WBB77564.1 helix-turn-helix domain-containing protein [Micromonospora sp. WMMD882]
MVDPLAAEPRHDDVLDRPARGGAQRRAEAFALRAAGCSVNEIAQRVGVAKSTAYRWVGHLPLDGDAEAARQRRRAHSKLMTDARWEGHRLARDVARRETVEAAASWVRELRHRELILVGAAVYWCEGGKAKPWRPHDCRVKFINSDPALVGIFIRFLEALGVPRARLRFRVSIHETADAAAAVRWWADVVGASPDEFQPTTLKRHRPETVRKNIGDDYRGCLTIDVLRSSQLYWKIEGIMRGMSGEVPERGR